MNIRILTQEPFIASLDQDQTAQNVLSDLGSALTPPPYHPPTSKYDFEIRRPVHLSFLSKSSFMSV